MKTFLFMFCHGTGVIVIVGVGHVFDISAQVRRLIEGERPDVVCVELDPPRYQALSEPSRQRANVPLPYRLLSVFQKRLARSYGGEAGAEMLAAVDAARGIGSEVLLIDADAARLFRRLWTEMPPSEKVRLMLSSFTSLFLSRRTVEKELGNFQENEEFYLEEMSRQFPTLKRMLIDERNEIMARRIDEAASRLPSVLAVVGDGHVEGIVRLLARDDVRVVRLKELMGEAAERENGGDNAQATFHYQYPVRR